jgi:acetyl esterase
MPLDHRIQTLLQSMAGIEMPPFESLSPTAMRAIYDNPMASRQEPVASVEEIRVPGDDVELPARLYRPLGGAAESITVYFHGGGFVFGTLDTHDQTCRQLSNQLHSLVISVAYRLAPEHPFPTPLNDCFNATRWVAQHRHTFGIGQPALFVGGDSAGGNLAAAVALKARGSEVKIAGQLLFYPVLNRDFTTGSYQRGEHMPMLTTDMMRRFWNFYLGDAQHDDNPLACPTRAGTLADLPPAYVVTAELDPLRDEGSAYAQALQAAGVPVLHRDHAGMIHGFLGLPVVEETAKSVYADAGDFLRKHLR